MKYTIYLRTNTVNNKQYVGQTSDFKRRNIEWNCLKHTYANEHICNDREKYGLDAWTVETLAETDNREDAWELEQRFINDYNTLWPNGYNLESGGHIGKQLCEEMKLKKSLAMKGEKHPMYGKHHTEEAKKKISEANKGKQLTDETKQKISESMKWCVPWNKGKHHTEETKQKMSEALKIPVYQYTLDGKLVAIWPSATDAEEKLGIKQCNISSCCHGKRKTTGGFKWSF